MKPLSPKQLIAVAEILKGRQLIDVAAQLGITPRTLHTWRQLPQFVAALRDGRRQILDAVTGLLLQESTQAAMVLYQLLSCNEPPTQARAATAILDRAMRGVELADLAEEVAELRALVEESNREHEQNPSRSFRRA
jgi:hypothetical protein